MRKVKIMVHQILAGILEEQGRGQYRFIYDDHYQGAPVSLTMPVINTVYEFEQFPPFFEGLLPEGLMLEALLRRYKLDKQDYLGQLICVGQDMVGAVTVEKLE